MNCQYYGSAQAPPLDTGCEFCPNEILTACVEESRLKRRTINSPETATSKSMSVGSSEPIAVGSGRRVNCCVEKEDGGQK